MVPAPSAERVSDSNDLDRDGYGVGCERLPEGKVTSRWVSDF